jgi:hypothetical protein
MPLFELTEHELVERKPVTFAHLEIREREDLQRTLRDRIDVLGDDLLVVSEEYGDWENAHRRIDLLALDKQRRLVVIELKRTDTGGHMELQALRYAAMVSAMTFAQVVAAHEAYLERRGELDSELAAQSVRDFLEIAPDEEPAISSQVRIILVSGDFSREITTAVLWLNGFDGMDIRCVRLVPYELQQRMYLDIEQVIPLPQAADYYVPGPPEGPAPATRQRGRPGLDPVRRQHARRLVGPAPEAAGRPRDEPRAGRARRSDGADRSDAPRALPRSRRRGARSARHRGGSTPAGRHRSGAYFVDSPVVETNRTYVISKMWGLNTVPMLTRLRDAFPDAGVDFEAATD